MPIKLNTASGGGVILQGANTASDTTLTVPAVTATVLTDSAGVLNIGSGQVYKDASGNVGIGTSSPSTRLEVSSSGIPALINSSNNQYVLQLSYLSNTSKAYIGTFSNALIFAPSSGTEAARIDSSGNLLVGTTAGTYRLNVKHTDNNQLWLDNDGSTSTGMVYANNGTSKVSAYWHNSLARYYITAVSAGVYLASGGTSWTSASDERVKDIVEPIDNAIEKLSNWRTVIGKYKTDEEGTRRSFLIAQDVQETFPEAVDSSNTEEFGLRYQDTIPLLVKAIQELKAEVDQLRAQVEAK